VAVFCQSVVRLIWSNGPSWLIVAVRALAVPASWVMLLTLPNGSCPRSVRRPRASVTLVATLLAGHGRWWWSARASPERRGVGGGEPGGVEGQAADVAARVGQAGLGDVAGGIGDVVDLEEGAVDVGLLGHAAVGVVLLVE